MPTVSPARPLPASAAREWGDLDDNSWVLAAPFRAHVAHLMTTTHIPWPIIAYQANVPLATIRTLLFGRDGRARPKIIRSAARRILNLTAEDFRWVRVHQVSAAETGARIRRLRARGVGWEGLSGFLGIDVSTCQAIAHGQHEMCSVMVSALARAACELMHAWGSAEDFA